MAVPVAQVNALRVPTSAVNVRGQMEIAFVVTNQHAQMRLVKTGKQLDGAVEIVSGLSNGEQLVVDGADKLLDGQPVEVRRGGDRKSNSIEIYKICWISSSISS